MLGGKKFLAVVPARGGSKGLPGKNIKLLNNKPLICWTLERAKESKYIDHIFVSTDSEEIANVCRKKCGVSIDHLRPAQYAMDETPTADVIEYTLDYLEEQGKSFDYIILLEPTSPMRKEDDIDRIIELACEHADADGVISVGEVHMEHPGIVKKINANGVIEPYLDSSQKVTQRQQLDKAYFPYGVAYLIKVGMFRKVKSFYTENIVPYYLERWQGYEVDDIFDLVCIESIMKEMHYA